MDFSEKKIIYFIIITQYKQQQKPLRVYGVIYPINITIPHKHKHMYIFNSQINNNKTMNIKRELKRMYRKTHTQLKINIKH